MLTSDSQEHAIAHKQQMDELFELIMARIRADDFPTEAERPVWFKFQDWEAKHGVQGDDPLTVSA